MVSPYLNNARGLVDTKNVGCEYHGLFCLGQAKFKTYPKTPQDLKLYWNGKISAISHRVGQRL